MSPGLFDPPKVPGLHPLPSEPHPVTPSRAPSLASNAAAGGVLVTDEHLAERARRGPSQADDAVARDLAEGSR